MNAASEPLADTPEQRLQKVGSCTDALLLVCGEFSGDVATSALAEALAATIATTHPRSMREVVLVQAVALANYRIQSRTPGFGEYREPPAVKGV